MNQQATALVTGAGAGIGKATALAFAAAGCDVVVADLDQQAAETVAETINNLGKKALPVAVDIADQGAVKALHESIMSEFGRLDYACNNAGIEGLQAPTAEATLANFDKVISVNLRGVFMCMQAQLRLMQQQGHGAIVNLASVAALVGFAGLPAYCASKGGVLQLTKTAALEYAEHNIRINAVCPGAIKTDMIDRLTHKEPQAEKQFAGLHPMNRLGTAREIADAIVWLCLPGASFITGIALPVDGGMTAR